ESAGLSPNVVVEGGEMDAVLRFVERGLGLAIVPAMVLVDRPHLTSVQLVEPDLSRTGSLAKRADVRPTRAASAMEDTIPDTARALTADDTGLAGHVRLAHCDRAGTLGARSPLPDPGVDGGEDAEGGVEVVGVDIGS